MVSSQPRKVRKALYNTPNHRRRKQIASHLAEDLLLRYNRRTLTIIVGDEVRIMRGGSRGKTGKVTKVDTKARKIVIEGITHKKADGTQVALPIDPSNVLLVRLNLEDKRRRAKLGETAEPPKKEAEKPAQPTPPASATPAPPAAPAPTPAPKPEAKPQEAIA